MGRPKLARYGVSIGETLDFIEALIARAIVVNVTGAPRGCKDPDDDVVIETAEIGSAAYLITGDAHLLSSDVREQLERRGIVPITAADFLHARSWSPLCVPESVEQARATVAGKDR